MEVYEDMLDWETGVLYPICVSVLQSASLNKSLDSALKSQLIAVLSNIGTIISHPTISTWIWKRDHVFWWRKSLFKRGIRPMSFDSYDFRNWGKGRGESNVYDYNDNWKEILLIMVFVYDYNENWKEILLIMVFVYFFLRQGKWIKNIPELCEINDDAGYIVHFYLRKMNKKYVK